MNIHTRQSRAKKRTTQAAEAMMRWRWLVSEIEEMVKAGIIAEDERVELIGGELVPMSAKGVKHEVLKTALMQYWARRLPDDLQFAQETTFHINEDTYLEPDFIFYRKSDGLAGLKPSTCLLAVEVADSSLHYDLHRKARLYAVHGIRENWVINAETLATHIHRAPGLDGYDDIREVPPEQALHLEFAPALNVTLGTLELV